MKKITITRTYETYKYEELSKEIQEKLLEKEIEYCIESYCECFLYEDMLDYAGQLLQKYFGQKAKLNKICYDLSYCQGSGAMIEFNLYYYNCNVTIKQHGHYYHEYSFIIEENGENYLSDNRYKYLHDKIVDMNRELSKYGYNLIDWKNFTEQAKEQLEENTYLENGEIFNN